MLFRSRAIEILVNAVLPFLAAGGASAGDGLRQRAVELYCALPAPGSYGATGHLERALTLKGGRRLAGSARRQQGLLYLLQCYCQRGGCTGTCPLCVEEPG